MAEGNPVAALQDILNYVECEIMDIEGFAKQELSEHNRGQIKALKDIAQRIRRYSRAMYGHTIPE